MREKLEPVKIILQQNINGSIGQVLAFSLVAFVVFFLLGWMLFGWVLFPVEYIPPEPEPLPYGMNGVTYESKAVYVYLLQEWYAYSQDDQKLPVFVNQIQDLDDVACNMASQSTEFAERARLITIAGKINGQGCIQDGETNQ